MENYRRGLDTCAGWYGRRLGNYPSRDIPQKEEKLFDFQVCWVNASPAEFRTSTLLVSLLIPFLPAHLLPDSHYLTRGTDLKFHLAHQTENWLPLLGSSLWPAENHWSYNLGFFICHPSFISDHSRKPKLSHHLPTSTLSCWVHAVLCFHFFAHIAILYVIDIKVLPLSYELFHGKLKVFLGKK